MAVGWYLQASDGMGLGEKNEEWNEISGHAQTVPLLAKVACKERAKGGNTTLRAA